MFWQNADISITVTYLFYHFLIQKSLETICLSNVFQATFMFFVIAIEVVCYERLDQQALAHFFSCEVDSKLSMEDTSKSLFPFNDSISAKTTEFL